MNFSALKASQQGVILVTALLFLLILTIISVFTASNSSLELKMAGNMQSAYAAFQAAEAGALATLALSSTKNDPFNGQLRSANPFVNWPNPPSTNPLKKLSAGSDSISVKVTLNSPAIVCPRRMDGFSTDLLACEYYDIQSTHAFPKKAQSEVHLGVVKTIIVNQVY